MEFPAEFPATFPAAFPADFPTRFPKLDTDWLAPHHPIPNDKLLSITAFLKKTFSPAPCPTEFPAAFSTEFPTRFPKMDTDWLAPQHPIPNDKLPPITTLISRPTYHKSAKVFPPPFPQISWEPQANE